jgi:ADP-heptose:LPS heptosyltransferase
VLRSALGGACEHALYLSMRRLVLRSSFSVGDIVMMTAAVRDLHRRYPQQFVTDVRTGFPELWENNPYVTPLAEDEPEVETIECTYPLIDDSNEVPYHALHGYIHFLNERLGLQIKPTDFKGDIHLSEQEKAWYSQVHEAAGADIPFWIVMAGGKYDITIKWWASERYQKVVDHFRGRIQFVQVGDEGHHHPKLDGVVDLRGQTNLRELVRLVYHSQGVVCGVTSLMHLAAAVETKDGKRRPCVVVAGGREPAHWEAYPHHQFIHTNGALPCCSEGGCWRDRTFPLNDGDDRDKPENLCVDLKGMLPRCMSMITPAEVIRRIKTYFAGGALKYLTKDQCGAAEAGVRATQNNAYDLLSLSVHSAGMACDEFARQIPPCPAHFSGRGIVICAGGERYFTNAWVCINMLRQLGCRLPIQLWHLGSEEIDNTMRALVRPLGVNCIDAYKVRKTHPIRMLGGWQLKPYAILYSRYKEVLFLDADNVPCVNPEYLFDTPEFAITGAVFWPDHEQLDSSSLIWKSCGMVKPSEPEFESGQMVLDKGRCWRPLRLAIWFNEHSDFYYQHLYGDKETFHLAFRKLGQRYSLVPHPVQAIEGTMCQRDFEGRRIFQHRNTDKWELSLSNARVDGFLFEEECRKYILRLRQLWRGA